MRGEMVGDNLTGIIGGAVDIEKGSIVSYDEATGLVTLAYDESQELFVACNSARIDLVEAITIRSIKTLNRSFMCPVTETCVRGTELYLDEQASLAAATGKLKVTAGTADRVLFRADDAVITAGQKVPVISEEHFSTIEDETDEDGLVATVGGAVTISKGAICTYTAATGVATLAFDEDSPMFVALNTAIVGAEIKLVPVTTLNKVWDVVVTEAVAVGDSLYLDEQANVGAATGKLRKTADSGSITSTLTILTANEIGAAADAVVEAYSITNLAAHA